jgi:hypothetical protein
VAVLSVIYQSTSNLSLTAEKKIFERITSVDKSLENDWMPCKLYNFNTGHGEGSPWFLQPRIIPFAEKTPIVIDSIEFVNSATPLDSWQSLLRGTAPLTLAANTAHHLELLAPCHSTAFLRIAAKRPARSGATLRITYSEAYEGPPTSYPWIRNKGNRLDKSNGKLFGPCDLYTFSGRHESADPQDLEIYEPFWFRTFRFLVLDIETGDCELELLSLDFTQVNYPLAIKADWLESNETETRRIWEVSLRTLRNCMFDGYSDCPFYEQLQ